jgi:hypothetical protein
MARFDGIKYFILLFYRGSRVVCLIVIYEYESILVILFDDILLNNIKFIVKYH